MYDTGFDIAHPGSLERDFTAQGPREGPPDSLGTHDLAAVVRRTGIGEVGWIEVQPFGVVGNELGRTFLMRILGWTGIKDGNEFAVTPLADVRVTLGDIAAKPLDKRYGFKGSRMASSIELVQPYHNVQVFNGPLGLPSFLRCDVCSAHYLEFEFARNCRPKAEIATALWKPLGKSVDEDA
jgi:hypothetical protein